MKTHKQKKGFTLIELLITIAIIAIFSGMVLTAVVAPMKERELATQNMEFEAGAGKFFAQFMSDAHNCSILDLSTSGTAIMKQATRNGEDVVYTVIEDGKAGTLRRKVGDRPSAFLLDNMKSFSVQQPTGNDRLWTVSIEQNAPRFQTRKADLARSLSFLPKFTLPGNRMTPGGGVQ